jgi:hypothetical protein
VNTVGASVGLLDEKPRQPFRGDVGGDAGGIEAGAGRDNSPVVNVGGEDLQLERLLEYFQVLLKKNAEGIGFLAGGAAGYPDANQAARGFTGKKPGDDLPLQGRKGFRVTKKLVTPINRSRRSASTSAGVCCR